MAPIGGILVLGVIYFFAKSIYRIVVARRKCLDFRDLVQYHLDTENQECIQNPFNGFEKGYSSPHVPIVTKWKRKQLMELVRLKQIPFSRKEIETWEARTLEGWEEMCKHEPEYIAARKELKKYSLGSLDIPVYIQGLEDYEITYDEFYDHNHTSRQF
ncbi:hypothetical protein [Lewinella sp. JB7]|uniref:hypothetical protein n=1 Tax=Lewinella sp. JB7 TaxID=2962887 RepID=UPI0020C983F8|nr:hypothetical protein [Lewinella sp. JB7]MCP9237911.1 hypothetical protein [Lewinella sp. JB7]